MEAVKEENRVKLSKFWITSFFDVLKDYYSERVSFSGLEDLIHNLAQEVDLNTICDDIGEFRQFYPYNLATVAMGAGDKRKALFAGLGSTRSSFPCEKAVLLNMLQYYGLDFSRPGFRISPIYFDISINGIGGNLIYFLDSNFSLHSIHDGKGNIHRDLGAAIVNLYETKQLPFSDLEFAFEKLSKNNPNKFYRGKDQFLGSQAMLESQYDKLNILYDKLNKINPYNYDLLHRKLFELNVMSPDDI